MSEFSSDAELQTQGWRASYSLCAWFVSLALRRELLLLSIHAILSRRSIKRGFAAVVRRACAIYWH